MDKTVKWVLYFILLIIAVIILSEIVKRFM